MRALAIILAPMTGGQARALTPLQSHDAGVGVYDVGWHEGGFVFNHPYASGGYQRVLDDCRNGRRLVMTLRPKGTNSDIRDAESAFHERLPGALTSKQPCTMGRFRSLAKSAGAATKLGRAAYESCGCQLSCGD